MPIDRCICHNISFKELRRLATERDLSLPELSRLTGCCTGCGLCKPYVRSTLITGQTSFPADAPPPDPPPPDPQNNNRPDAAR